ncbi:hypothetical protein [Bacillus sp. 165]|uniref:hypothetical protein n=1 Tax=Bacillus sp. 165 TaxID=1529117 RepID=UPI001ADD082E|nr:hypothetical protein [Bacillus sp. 165]MBO9130222.1 hypothetical protein [Bacillus sp. 165]
MVYKGKSQRGVLAALFLINAISYLHISSGSLLYLNIIGSLFVLIGMCIHYTVRIEKGYITYQIYFMRIPVFKKDVYANQIAQMKFARFGWVTKGTIVKLNKGMSLRIINFTPDTIYGELIEYATTHDITIIVTEDYKIISR